MSYPAPVHIGRYPAIRAGSSDDYGINATNDLEGSETLSTATFVVTLAGVVVAGVVTASTVSSPSVSFRVAAPATAGAYLITATLGFSDSRSLERTADLWVV